MAIRYRIYTNDGKGGRVNFSTPIGETGDLQFTTGAVALDSDNWFAVRAYDTQTSIEEASTSAMVRVRVDAQGNEVTNLPNQPHAVSAIAGPAGACLVKWAYAPSNVDGEPEGFHVYLTKQGDAASGQPAFSVPYVRRQFAYRCSIPGPFDRSSYVVEVRCYNRVGVAGNGPTSIARLNSSPQSYQMDAIVATTPAVNVSPGGTHTLGA